MSYIRHGSIYKYVEGESNDYIFSDGERIVCYGKVSNESIVDILGRRFLEDDKIFREWLLPILAERLNVKLRKKLLTKKQEHKIFLKQMKEANALWGRIKKKK